MAGETGRGPGRPVGEEEEAGAELTLGEEEEGGEWVEGVGLT